jgi:hypothetical protein
MHRLHFLVSSGATLAGGLHAQPALPPASLSLYPYARLQGGMPHHLTPEQDAQRVTNSPTPAGAPNRGVSRAVLPLPRSEMAWATVAAGRMHIVGGYSEGAVNRAYHHVYEPAADRGLTGVLLPRGADYVAVASTDQQIWALGGFTEQNRGSDTQAFVYHISDDRWDALAPLPWPWPRPRGVATAVVLNGRLHLIGGASEPAAERASVFWHQVCDPKADRWRAAKPLPGTQDHLGRVALITFRR